LKGKNVINGRAIIEKGGRKMPLKLLKQLTRKFNGNRNIVLRVIDGSVLATLLWAGAYVIMYANPLRMPLAVLTAVVLTGGIFFLQKARLARYLSSETAKIAARLKNDALLLISTEKIVAALQELFPDEKIIFFQQARSLCVDDVLESLRLCPANARLRICVSASVSAECREFLARRSQKIEISDAGELLKILSLPEPSYAAFERFAESQAVPKPFARLRRLLLLKNASWGKYLILALFFTLLSLFGRHILYYRILSAIAALASSLGIYFQIFRSGRMSKA
jgi:hypothetical protein